MTVLPEDRQIYCTCMTWIGEGKGKLYWFDHYISWKQYSKGTHPLSSWNIFYGLYKMKVLIILGCRSMCGRFCALSQRTHPWSGTSSQHHHLGGMQDCLPGQWCLYCGGLGVGLYIICLQSRLFTDHEMFDIWMQPLTTTWYNSLVLSFSLLKISNEI